MYLRGSVLRSTLPERRAASERVFENFRSHWSRAPEPIESPLSTSNLNGERKHHTRIILYSVVRAARLWGVSAAKFW